MFQIIKELMKYKENKITRIVQTVKMEKALKRISLRLWWSLSWRIIKIEANKTSVGHFYRCQKCGHHTCMTFSMRRTI